MLLGIGNLKDKTGLLLIFSGAALLYVLGMVLFVRLMRLEKKLKKQCTDSQEILETAKILIIKFDFDGNIKCMNRYALQKLKMDRFTGKKIFDLTDMAYSKELLAYVEEYKAGRIKKDFELAVYDTDHNPVYVLFNFHCGVAENDTIELLGIDFTDRVMTEKQLEEKQRSLQYVYHELSDSEKELKKQIDTIKQLIFIDTVTGLPNRSGMKDKAETLKEQGYKQLTLLFLGMDDFKLINGSYGYTMGDQVLKQVAEGLKELSGTDAMIARSGGDEFCILLWNCKNRAAALNYIKNIQSITQTEYKADNEPFNVTFSIGAAISPGDGEDFETLYKNAVTAMNKAKKTGKNKYVFYSDDLNEENTEKLNIQCKLRNALLHNELRLEYQPQVSTVTNRTLGYEALLRWTDKSGISIPPGKFIKIAEETGLIIPIGNRVIQMAVEFLSKLHLSGYPGLFISVNISVLQLMQPGFINVITDTLKMYNMPPEALELEITESTLMESVDTVTVNIEYLRKKGVKFAIDDFGTGYSSLNRLATLPIDTIKIDKSFIDSIGFKDEENLLTGSIIDMAKRTGKKVVAEGVETLTQYRYLVKSNCDVIQGYLFGRPQAGEEILANLRQNGKKNTKTTS